MLAVVALAVMVGTISATCVGTGRCGRGAPRCGWSGRSGLGAAALFSLGILLDGTIGFSFTLGGIVGAVPFLLWAERLRRTA